MTQQEMMNQLEAMIDAPGNTTCDVLLALGRVCDEKAEHVLTNWQDKNLGRAWNRLARKLDRVAAEIDSWK